jgi:hypothetical protein
MKITLLEKAKSRKVKGKGPDFTVEDYELAIAWLKREITNSQADYAYRVRASISLKRIARCFRELYSQGKIVINLAEQNRKGGEN